MNAYLGVKTLHIISSAVLFGTGLGIAFFFYAANLGSDLSARWFAARTTVFADFCFTLPAVLIQPLTGFWLLAHSGFTWNQGWLELTYLLYLIAGVCWLPVVVIQLKLKAMLRHSLTSNTPLPDSYRRLFRWWFWLGFPAFLGLLAVFFLMVLKPTW